VTAARVPEGARGMRQSARTVVRKGPTNGGRPSVAEMQARIDALEAELSEALEQQTATAEILQVINYSPGDLQPVFDAMLEKATRLCQASFGILWTYERERFYAAALHGVPAAFAKFLSVPVELADSAALGDIANGHSYVHIADLAASDTHRQSPLRRATVDLGGARTGLAVPLVEDDAVLGIFVIYRQEVRPFTDKQIALLQNFAAQAVIAMENARLLTELRQRTRDLEESLEYQTASSDVLRVISGSGAELGPVLDTLVETAARICRADSGFIFRLHDGLCRMVASFGIPAEYKHFQERNPIAPGRGTLAGRTVLERRAVHIDDAATDPEYIRVQAVRLGRQRTMLGVPLIRENALIGVITLARSYVEPFAQNQIGLVTTFADQAVIAIENARLLGELRVRTAELGRSVEELKMLGEVGQAVSSTLDLRAVLSTILTRSISLTRADAGAIFRYNRAGREFRLVEEVGWDETLAGAVGDLRIAEAETAMGEAAVRREPIQIADLALRPSAPLRDVSLSAGIRSVLIVPLVGRARILGALVLQRRATGEFPPESVRLMQTLASQSVLAIQNARLFREIADKSEQLALASEHKSQFLANMSHELRTPLNAILGYAELLVDGVYGQLPDRPRGVLERIQNNGRHLLALINDVLDLAKIEAGQLTLTIEDYTLPEVVKSIVTATEPLATSKGLKFITALQSTMPIAHGDARRVSQVLLNLVGNAIKFTDEGEVEIRAAADNGQFVLTVRDTGPGIAESDQERIFGEFQQIDNTNTRKKGGTGLGLAISKRMVEMQGGTISVESVLGQGSTFRVVLPVCVDEALEEAA
jgi:signal transduction histidine kinase/putative methionine-R-sulfoxide reductase with GAF domain